MAASMCACHLLVLSNMGECASQAHCGQTGHLQSPFIPRQALIDLVLRRKDAVRIDEAWWQAEHTAAPAGKDAVDPEKLYQADLEPRGPAVKAGDWEADLKERRLYPIYWEGEPRMLLRGTWFVQTSIKSDTWLPLPHGLVLQLEHAWQSRCATSCHMHVHAWSL